MITYDGIISRNKTKYLKLSNELGSIVEIPLDEAVANLIGQYVMSIATTPAKAVECLNDEPYE